MNNGIQYQYDNEQIVTLTMDLPGVSVNTLGADFREAFTAAISKIEQNINGIKGIILTSAKDTFFAGGDLKELVQVSKENIDAFKSQLDLFKQQLRQLETWSVPVVAALNGSALGGGWELALACHHRISLDQQKIKFGLPEVTLGLLPGAGGVIRTVRLLGLESAMPLLLEGKQFSPKEGLQLGLIHELVTEPEQLLPTAKQWLLSVISQSKKIQQPWDRKDYRMPGGKPSQPAVAQKLMFAPAMLVAKTQGCYPAPEAILATMVEGAQVDFDSALIIETRYFIQLTLSAVAKNMINTFWFQLNAIKSGKNRPDIVTTETIQQVGVLGAGMMGAGIAYALAQKGIQVKLKDVTLAQAEQGKQYSDSILTKRVKRNRITAAQKDEILNRIQLTTEVADLASCQLIIEAVFEDAKLKAEVTQEVEAQLVDSAVFASNTSTIPITQLAEVSQRPEQFVGLHFFSPVDKMQLVEIIKGEQTATKTVAQAFDLVRQIGKIPIVVNDSRGFFTSRVFGTFVMEGAALLAEGQNPAEIEQAAKQVGMPVGPLAVTDEVALTLIEHIQLAEQNATDKGPQVIHDHPGFAVIKTMIHQFQRPGKAKGAGYYDYPQQGKKTLWSGLYKHYVKPDAQISYQDVKDRLLFIQAIETVRCLEEKVLMSVREANIGSIFGLGFPPWTGGALQFINYYGIEPFIARAQHLMDSYGERFKPPKLLLQMSEQRQQFQD